jgi:release factor glutamine methyltransferase
MRTVAQLLAASGLPTAEARALLAHRLGVPRERLIARPAATVDSEAAADFAAAAGRRAAGEPLAYLLGQREFYGRPFTVSPDVLVPRPETELLVDLALERLRGLPHPRVLDLGTGSGCVAVTLALEHPGAQVTATDASAAALAVAQGNAARLGATVDFRRGDWYAALPPTAEFDLVVSNPPYVAAGDPHLDDLRYEPALALTDGGDGLGCLHRIVRGARAHLAKCGWLLVEHGHDQSEPVRALFEAAGMAGASRADLQGHLRVTLAQA